MASEKENVKAALEAAKVQIGHAISRVDKANPVELAALRGAAHTLSAFVDFNSGCGKSAITPAEISESLRG